jgi:hypothetical protein
MMASPEGAIRGDHGLGLCLTCVFEYKAAARDRAAAQRRGGRASVLPAGPPQFAIVMVPAPVPAPGLGGAIAGRVIVPVGACYDHVFIATAEGDDHEG